MSIDIEYIVNLYKEGKSTEEILKKMPLKYRVMIKKIISVRCSTCGKLYLNDIYIKKDGKRLLCKSCGRPIRVSQRLHSFYTKQRYKFLHLCLDNGLISHSRYLYI